MGDDCSFQPLIFQGVSLPWELLDQSLCTPPASAGATLRPKESPRLLEVVFGGFLQRWGLCKNQFSFKWGERKVKLTSVNPFFFWVVVGGFMVISQIFRMDATYHGCELSFFN